MPNTLPKYGWRKDRLDVRDFRFEPDPDVLANLPAQTHNRAIDELMPMFDQSTSSSCHDSKTEVLTDKGWKLFADVSLEDNLASVSVDTQELIYEKPTRLVRYDFNGDVIVGNHQFLNFKVTPDHKMVVRKWNERLRTLDTTYSLVNASDIGWYCGLINRVVWEGKQNPEFYILPGVEHQQKPQRTDRHIPMHLWLRFLGVYLAEGTLLSLGQRKHRTSSRGTKQVVSYKIQLAASKEREKCFIRTLLEDMGVHALELTDRFTFENKQIYMAVSELGLNGVKAVEKFVPDFVFDLPAEQIKNLLLGHFIGDGSAHKNEHKIHCTSSAKLAEDLQRLIFLAGYGSGIYNRGVSSSIMKDGREVHGKHDAYIVSVNEKRNLSINRMSDIGIEHYDGEVFCAEVPTHHTLVTRREGKVLISGNCTGNSSASEIEAEWHRQGIYQGYTPSRLWLYLQARKVEGTLNSDSGAEIRDIFAQAATLGVVPESGPNGLVEPWYWPWHVTTTIVTTATGVQKVETVDNVTVDAPPQSYIDALQHKTFNYFSIAQDEAHLKACLAAGYSFVFGITVFDSFESDAVAKSGIVPMPSPTDNPVGGHAVRAIDYDDSTQTFLVRNSWGPGWGDKGYFHLPYIYALNSGLASDFWTVRVQK